MSNQRAEEIMAKAVERRQQAIAGFPFERVEVPGEQALATWLRYRHVGRGYPVVLGDDKSVADMAIPFMPSPFPSPDKRSVDEIIALSAAIRHPQDLAAKLASDNEQSIQSLPPLGEWPEEAEPSPGLSVAGSYKGMFAKVHIGIIPTDDWTTIPAHLRWGGWNACPPPEYHVAALRSWRDRYGAELAGMSFDTMNLKVARRPQTREEAVELAREQYVYCNDITDQGFGTVRNLAAALMANDWWWFWWD